MCYSCPQGFEKKLVTLACNSFKQFVLLASHSNDKKGKFLNVL